MKLPVISALLLVILCVATFGQAHKFAASSRSKPSTTPRAPEIGQTGTVVDETLSVLRMNPSLYSDSIQRMRRGRKVQILAVTEADGVKFYKVTAPPANFGWVQSDAVFGKFRPGDEERLANLVQASEGFDQIEVAAEFLNLYPQSKFSPAILLLVGDVLEEVATKLSTDANKKLKRSEMAASAAPVHSYFLNFVSLDRYRKAGAVFIFNSATRQFHYDGADWKQIIAKFPSSPQAAEAKKRLDTLSLKMEKPPAK